jgi:hypothetical protein
MCSPFPEARSVKTALLLASVPSLAAPHYLAPVITSAATEAQDRLVIILFSRLFNERGDRWDDVHLLLTFVYVQATKVAQDLGKMLLSVDVLVRGMDSASSIPDLDGVDKVFRVRGGMYDSTFVTRIYIDCFQMPSRATQTENLQLVFAPPRLWPETCPHGSRDPIRSTGSKIQARGEA